MLLHRVLCAAVSQHTVGGQLYTGQQVCLCVALVSVCRQVATAAPAAPAKQSPHKQLRGRQPEHADNLLWEHNNICMFMFYNSTLLRSNAICNI